MSDVETEPTQATGKAKSAEPENGLDALETVQLEDFDWLDTFSTIGDWLDMFLSGFAGVFSKKPEKYDFEGKYMRMTGERWTEAPSLKSTKPHLLKKAWEETHQPGTFTFPDGTTVDYETGETLLKGEEQLKVEQATLEAMEKGRKGDKLRNTEKESAPEKTTPKKSAAETTPATTPVKDAPKTPGAPSKAEITTKESNRHFTEAASQKTKPDAAADSNPGPASVFSKIGNVVSAHQITVFSDTNHANQSIPELFVSKEHIQTLADAGVENICTEDMSIFQDIADRLSNGEITEQEFKAIYLAQSESLVLKTEKGETLRADMAVTLIKNAKEHGIKVHYVDNQEGFIPSEDAIQQDIETLNNALQGAFIQHVRNDPSYHDIPTLLGRREAFVEFRKEFYAQHDDKNLIKRINNALGEYSKDWEGLSDSESLALKLSNRKIADPHVADRVNEIAQDGKTVVIYGANHTRRDIGDLDHGLNAPVIALWGSNDWTEQKNAPPYEDRADFNIILDQNKWIDASGKETELTPMNITVTNAQALAPEVKSTYIMAG